MELLWITENYPPSRGGMAQSCDRIIFGLQGQGIDVHLIHFTNRKEPFRTEYLEHGSYTAAPVFDNEAHTLNLCWNHVMQMAMEFDKIVAFGGYLPVISAPVFARWLKKPLITLLRGNDFYVSVFTPRRRQMLHECLAGSENTGCVSTEMVKKLNDLWPEVKTIYTPNGIRLDDWQIMKSEERFSVEWRKENASGKMVAGVFGHLKDKKGLDVLIRAIQSSVELKGRILLLMAGDIDENSRQMLETSQVEYVLFPFLDRFELLKFYAVCDMVVIPSYYDGMPNVLLEAGALGVSVLGSDTGGIRDVLYPDQKEFLFSPGNSDELRERLIMFTGLDRQDRKERGDELQRIIRGNFTNDHEIGILQKLIFASHEKIHES